MLPRSGKLQGLACGGVVSTLGLERAGHREDGELVFFLEVLLRW